MTGVTITLPVLWTRECFGLSGLILLTLALSLGPLTVASVTSTQFGTFAVIRGFAFTARRGGSATDESGSR